MELPRKIYVEGIEFIFNGREYVKTDNNDWSSVMQRKGVHKLPGSWNSPITINIMASLFGIMRV